MRQVTICFMAAALSVLVASCQKECAANKEESKINVVLDASINNDATKVSYSKNGSIYNGAWTTGDAISLISGSNTNACLNYTTGNQFLGDITAWEGNQDIYAVYPYSSTAYSISDGNLAFDASTQTITAGDLNYGNGLMVAESNGPCNPLPGMTFNQAMAFVKINITNLPADAHVTKVVVSNQSLTDNAQTLVGSASIDMTDGAIVGTPVYTAALVGNVISAVDGANTVVNFAVLPTATVAKYTFSVTLSNDVVYSKTLSVARTFVKNTIYTLSYALSSDLMTDMIAMVTYGPNGTNEVSGYYSGISGINLSTKKLEGTPSPSLYTSIIFGKVNYSSSLSNVGVISRDKNIMLNNGFTVEAYIMPNGSFSGEHKAVGCTGGSGFCVGFDSTDSGWTDYSTREAGCYTYTNMYSPGTSFETFSGYASSVGRKLTNPTDNRKWIHLVAVYDPASHKMTLYDQTPEESWPSGEDNHVNQNSNLSLRLSTSNIGIAGSYCSSSVTNVPAFAICGPVRIWKRPMTKAEVTDLYNAEPAGLADDTVSNS